MMKRSMCALALVGLLSAAADDLPFWGTSPDGTNRTADVSFDVQLLSFGSWEFQDACETVYDFSSMKFGLLLLLK